MCAYVANLICGCKGKAFIWIVQVSANHSTRNSEEWCVYLLNCQNIE